MVKCLYNILVEALTRTDVQNAMLDWVVNSYLPGTGDTLITKGVLPGRGTPLHSGVLTPANIPNVDISGTQFLVAGDCVRAIPLLNVHTFIT